MLSKEELRRYKRHLIISGFSEEKQIMLKKSRVLLVGAGGLGSPVAMYLAASGIGLLGLIDNDIVSVSNLQRQILYNAEDIDKSKVETAKSKLKKINPDIEILTYNQKLDINNASEIISNFDIIVDCTDNFQARYLIDDICSELNKPFVYGSINEFAGQVSVFNYLSGPRFRDLFPEVVMSNDNEIGVLGPLPGIVGSIQAMEVIKIVTGLGEILSGKLLTIDAFNMNFNILKIV